MQLPAAVLRVVLENVPAGQSVGAELPATQYEPLGHALPVTPSTGVAVLDWLVQ
jgi:hypothetical protein